MRRSADANVALWNASVTLSGGAVAAGRKDGLRAAAGSRVELDGVAVVGNALVGVVVASGSEATLVRCGF